MPEEVIYTGKKQAAKLATPATDDGGEDWLSVARVTQVERRAMREWDHVREGWLRDTDPDYYPAWGWSSEA